MLPRKMKLRISDENNMGDAEGSVSTRYNLRSNGELNEHHEEDMENELTGSQVQISTLNYSVEGLATELRVFYEFVY